MWTFLKGNGERQYSALAPNCHLFEENEHKSAKFAKEQVSRLLGCLGSLCSSALSGHIALG